MPSAELRVESTRGPLVESVHRVSTAVVDDQGRLLAGSGDPDLVTFWRSAAKPFQALPLLDDGAADRFGLTDQELALTCASHSSEPVHLELVDGLLAKVGVPESALACGPHPPLSAQVAAHVVRTEIRLTPRWSNCSGKHAGMLALAKHHGFPMQGYERAGHPLQDRLLREVERWTGTGAGDGMVLGVDGCTTVCFGLPLRRMALAYARFGAAARPSERRLWRAMTSHPHLIAGTGRLCTDLMRAWPGQIVAKIGAEGIYSAAIPSRRLGIAVKVEDGDMGSSGIALLAVLRQLAARSPGLGSIPVGLTTLGGHAEMPVLDTRGELVGVLRAAGTLRFFDP